MAFYNSSCTSGRLGLQGADLCWDAEAAANEAMFTLMENSLCQCPIPEDAGVSREASVPATIFTPADGACQKVRQ